MQPADDIFEGATRLNLYDPDQMTPPQTAPREVDIASGNATASQPSTVFGTGRLTPNANTSINPTFYDDETELRHYEDQNPILGNDDGDTVIISDYPARIESVNTIAYTYTARAIAAPSILVVNVIPHTRPYDPTTINLNMASVGQLCKIIVAPDTGEKILVDVPETWGLELICD